MARKRAARVNYKAEAEKLQAELDRLSNAVAEGAVPLTMSISVSRITGMVGFSIGNPVKQGAQAGLDDLTHLSEALSVVQRQIDTTRTDLAKKIGAQEALEASDSVLQKAAKPEPDPESVPEE